MLSRFLLLSLPYTFFLDDFTQCHGFNCYLQAKSSLNSRFITTLPHNVPVHLHIVVFYATEIHLSKFQILVSPANRPDASPRFLISENDLSLLTKLPQTKISPSSLQTSISLSFITYRLYIYLLFKSNSSHSR